MTCIVGMIDKKSKSAIIGGDSAASDGSSVTVRRDHKVFEVGKFIIGCTSSFRMIQLLRFSLKLPEVKKKDIYEYMCTDFIDEVRRCFKDGGYLQKYTDGDEKGGSFLVAYKDRLFKIEDDFQVGESLIGIDSVGCGANYALGSLYSTSEQGLSSSDRILKSLESAEFFSEGVRRPFIIYNTEIKQ